MNNLVAAGLSETEAKSYAALLGKQDWKPSDLAKNVNETRTNMYKILDKLVALKLADRFDKNKVLHYRALHPARLLELSREHRQAREKSEDQLELTTQGLSSQYVKIHEQPGIQYFQGKTELKKIYFNQIKSGEPIYIIRPDYNMDIYDFEYMTEVRHLARKAGIPRYAITPDRDKAPINYQLSDPFMLLTRTWMNAEDYTAPVEWNVYGDKLAIMSFGDEAVGVVIESPQIARAFRQLYGLLDKGLRCSSEYKNFPRHAKYIGATG